MTFEAPGAAVVHLWWNSVPQRGSGRAELCRLLHRLFTRERPPNDWPSFPGQVWPLLKAALNQGASEPWAVDESVREQLDGRVPVVGGTLGTSAALGQADLETALHLNLYAAPLGLLHVFRGESVYFERLLRLYPSGGWRPCAPEEVALEYDDARVQAFWQLAAQHPDGAVLGFGYDAMVVLVASVAKDFAGPPTSGLTALSESPD